MAHIFASVLCKRQHRNRELILLCVINEMIESVYARAVFGECKLQRERALMSPIIFCIAVETVTIKMLDIIFLLVLCCFKFSLELEEFG